MSALPYPKYKDSKVQWLGAVPAHWEVKALKKIVAVPVTDGPHETPQFLDEGILFVSAEAVSSGRIDFSKARACISAEDNARYSLKYYPKLHDIYMVKSGATTGVTAIVEDRIDFNIWSPLAVIRCGEEAIPHFVLNFMRSRNFLEAITLNWSFGTQQNIGMGVIENLACVVPPREEQSAIATFLDRETGKIDTLVAEQERLMALLKEKRQAVISQAVTKGLDPNAPMKPSGLEWLGEVPVEWEIMPLKHLVRFVSGGTPSKEREDYWEGDIPWVSPKDMKKWIVTGDADQITAEAAAASNLVLVEPDTVMIVVRGMILAHSFPVALSGRRLTINQDMKALIPSHHIYSRYLAYTLVAHKQAVAEFIDEAGHGTRAMRMEGFASFKISVPSRDQQMKIVDFLDKEIDKLASLSTEAARAVALLKERRAALISAAVTGKIDVRGLAASAQEAA